MKLANKRIIVVGLGITGIAVARFLKKRGASVIVTDMSDESDMGPQAQQMHELGISMELGRHRPETFESAELIILSPGVSHMIEPVVRAQKLGIPVMGEIELASRFIRKPIVAVTGTNGKTTTTELLGNMLKVSGFDVFVGGNIGNPLIGYVDSDQKADLIVAEISSFQLDTIASFRPKIGVLLNITEDHLDRYPDFNAYAASKIRLFENQQKNDVAILNGSDPVVTSLTENLKGCKLVYPNPTSDEEGAVLNKHHINLHSDKFFGQSEQIRKPLSLNISNLKLKGRHNLENACAASLAALAAGARQQGIQDALDQFQGGAHRLECIRTIHGVHFYDDSKATNVDAVIRAVECFTKPLVLIMGGLDKGGNFHALREVLPRHTKNLIVMGKAAGNIKSAIEDIVPTVSATSMTDAVKQAYRVVSPGDVVLLSPGCASFDMYDNYAQRGDDFRKAVENLI